MNKKYLYGMITLASIFLLVALFGTANHFFKFYDPSGTKESQTKKPTKPTNPDKPVEPDKPTNPDKPVDPDKAQVINGYTCTTTTCSMVAGSSLIEGRYSFIEDGTNYVVLYDKKESKIVDTYTKVTVAGILYIAQKDTSLYGLLSVSSEVKEILDFTFKYIEYNTKENQFTVTTQSNSSYIVNNQGTKISPTYVAQIIQYNDQYIVTKSDNNEYHIFNFDNREFLTEYINSKSLYIELIDKYVGVITSDYKYVVYDFSSNSKIVGEYQLDKGVSDARARVNGSKLEIYRGTNVLKTIDL